MRERWPSSQAAFRSHWNPAGSGIFSRAARTPMRLRMSVSSILSGLRPASRATWVCALLLLSSSTPLVGSAEEMEALEAAIEGAAGALEVGARLDDTAQRPGGQSAWIPTRPGTRSTYAYVQERARTLEGQPAEIERVKGTRIDEIAVHDPTFGSNVVRVESNLRARSSAAKSEIVEANTRYYRVTGTRVELLAERIPDPMTANPRLTRYEVPLSILESKAEPGQRWQVGVRSERDLHTNLEGEVLGVQAVDTPAGRFEQCLVIRLTGEISGVVEAYGTRMEVPDGDITVTRWYAPGHGLVLAKEERNQTLVLEDGSTMDYSERTQFALRSTDLPKSETGSTPAALEPTTP